MTGPNRRREGSRMEDLAAEFLERHGVIILERNYRVRKAEIDIIGDANGTLIFVEVKARRSGKSGMPSEAVGEDKQKRICRCADQYMFEKGMDPYRVPVRFDVVTIGREEDRRERELAMRSFAGGSETMPGNIPMGHIPPGQYKAPAQGDVLRDQKRGIRWVRGAFPYRRGVPKKPYWRVY